MYWQALPNGRSRSRNVCKSAKCYLVSTHMGCYSLCQLAGRLSASSALLLYMDLTSGVAQHTLATCWREYGKTVFIRIPQTLFSRSFFCQTIPIPFSSNLFSSDSSNESSPFACFYFLKWSLQKYFCTDEFCGKMCM